MLRTEEEIQARIANVVERRDAIIERLEQARGRLSGIDFTPVQQLLNSPDLDKATAQVFGQVLQQVADKVQAFNEYAGLAARMGTHLGTLSGLYYSLGYSEDEIREITGDLDLENLDD